MKKLLQKRGETLVESLVSILLVTFIMLFLSTAIVAAARINRQLRDTDISYKSDQDRTASAGTLTVEGDNQVTVTSPILVYESENGYVYYRYGEVTP